MSDTQPPEIVPPRLREAIVEDLHPVRPLLAPGRRALYLLPLAPVMLLAAPLAVGVRVDAPRLGFSLSWGLSIVQLAAGFLVVVAALREAVPGRNLSRLVLQGTLAAAASLVIIVTLITWVVSPIGIERAVLFIWTICFVFSTLTALPVIAASAFLVARAYPVRPRIAGLLFGVGAGLMSDAGWRLFCHFSVPWHVFSAHAAAIVACGMMGAAAGELVARRRTHVPRPLT